MAAGDKISHFKRYYRFCAAKTRLHWWKEALPGNPVSPCKSPFSSPFHVLVISVQTQLREFIVRPYNATLCATTTCKAVLLQISTHDLRFFSSAV